MTTQPGTPAKTCKVCGDRYWSTAAHTTICASRQPVHDVARLIADGGAYRDDDAVRVARAYLETA